jgi:hypothetical protein
MSGRFRGGIAAADPAFAMRFEIPRSEVERARAHASGLTGPQRFIGMDQDYFRGKVEFNLGVPLAPDPILEFLAARRG